MFVRRALLAVVPLIAACAHRPPAIGVVPRSHALRIDCPRTQSLLADVPVSIAATRRITHDATLARLDRDGACFQVTLRAVAGETTRLHHPVAWSPRLEFESRRETFEIEPTSLRVIEALDDAFASTRLVRNAPPLTCGGSAWSTLSPLAPLLYVAPIPSLIWLAVEMPRHERLCHASERSVLVTDGDSDVESVRAEMCFATASLGEASETIELRLSDPVRDDAPLRFHWRIAH